MKRERPDTGQQRRSHTLWRPRHWPSWLAVGLGYVIGKLPYPVQMALGRRLGDLARVILPKYRHIAAVNLALCFPEKSAAERVRLLRAHFRSVGMGAVETLLCWWGPAPRIEGLAEIEGEAHLRAAAASGRGILLLSAHFTSLELGVRLGQRYLKQLGVVTTAMYKPPHDPVIHQVMRRRREAHIGEASIPDKQIQDLLAALKRGRAVWYAADQRARGRMSAQVTFFGQPAVTHLATSRLALLGKAVVVPFFTLRRDDGKGYRLIVQHPLEGFPSGDERADAQRTNDLIEAVVRRAPAQYFWLHKRFTLPDADPYQRGKDTGPQASE